MQRTSVFLIYATMVCSATAVDAQTMLRVDCTASDATPDGSTWAKAYPHLQDALAAAAGVAGPGRPVQIWVAACTYAPDGGTAPVGGAHTPGSGDRDAAFPLADNVEIYGGFPAGGGDGTFDARDPDPETNGSVLSGDLGGNDGPGLSLYDPTRADNAHHVVTADGAGASAVLDGFTVTGGNANAPLLLSEFGGGMLLDHSSPTVRNCRFTGNTAMHGGGAAILANSGPTLTHCTFSGNAAGENGGGVFIWDRGNPRLAGCSFRNNSAGYGGGGMTILSADPTLTGCSFAGNTAAFGGGMDCRNAGRPTLTTCSFTANTATDHQGGGVSTKGGAATLTGCVFDGNAAHMGGGMYNWNGSSPTLTDCSFANNQAISGGGGGVQQDGGVAVFAGCNFVGNVAEWGGGLQTWAQANVMVKGCLFEGNVAVSATDGAGGAMLHQSSTVTVAACTIRNNTAPWGGGMYCWDGGKVRATDCVITANAARQMNGGGVFNNGSHLLLANCVLAGNTTVSAGGGVFNWNHATTTMAGCTLHANAAERAGGGLCCTQAQAVVSNCILWGNDAAAGRQLVGANGDELTVSHSIVEGGVAAAYVSDSTPDGSGGNLDLDPQFVDEAGGDLHLAAGSPAIDAGSNADIPAGVLTDLEGRPRRSDDLAIADAGGSTGPVVDIGAYEAQGDCNGNGLLDETETDSDGDGAIDECDPCPHDDPNDSDGDGTCDSDDACAWFDDRLDADADGVPDRCDNCPTDPNPDQEPVCRPPDVLCVRAGATGADNGTSWTDAFAKLQDALAVVGDAEGRIRDIWVAAGTYTPGAAGSNRAATFALLSGVGVYGGFDGTETIRDARDPATNKTILSGDLNGNDGPDLVNRGDNCLHVVSAAGVNATAILDGFTITGGCADDASFPNNSGAGMFSFDSNPTLINCLFVDNTASAAGAGMCNIRSDTTLINCRFRKNVVRYDVGRGGGMFSGTSEPTLVNCVFAANTAGTGGAIANADSRPTIINTTLVGNWANSGPGGAIISDAASTATVANSIVWGNAPDQISGPATVTFSNVEGGRPDAGNIDALPQFTDIIGPDGTFGTDDDDLHLGPGSPCIDAGKSTALPIDSADLDGDGDTGEPLPLDVAGMPRFQDDPAIDDTGDPGVGDAIVDMGAHERTVTPDLVRVCPELGTDARPDCHVCPKAPSVGGLTRIGIRLSAPATSVGPICVKSTGTAAPASAELNELGGDYEVVFSGPIELAEWTTVEFTAENAAGQADICFHVGWMPGDCNQDGKLNLADTTKLANELDGLRRPQLIDFNGDGQVSLADQTKFDQILDGTSGEGMNPDGTGGWQGQGLPAKPVCTCP